MNDCGSPEPVRLLPASPVDGRGIPARTWPVMLVCGRAEAAVAGGGVLDPQDLPRMVQVKEAAQRVTFSRVRNG